MVSDLVLNDDLIVICQKSVTKNSKQDVDPAAATEQGKAARKKVREVATDDASSGELEERKWDTLIGEDCEHARVVIEQHATVRQVG